MKIWQSMLVVGGVGLSTLSSAHADLLEYSFTDTVGNEKAIQFGTPYINPASDIQFTLSGGLDRKVRMLIRADNGDIFSSVTGDLLGANDRILVKGREYYGARLNLTAPSDGTYEFVAQILASDGTVISEQIDPVRVHTTAPTSDGFHVEQGTPTDVPGFPLRYLGGPYFNYLAINNISSDIPLDVAHIAVKDLDAGGAVRTAQASVIGDSVEWKPDALFARGAESTFELSAQILDRAGNEAIIVEEIYYDNGITKRGSIEPVAIYDPANTQAEQYSNNSKFEGFVKYTPGMSVSINPLRVISRVPKENHIKYSPFGLGSNATCDSNCYNGSPFYEDDAYVYMDNDTELNIAFDGVDRLTTKAYDFGRNNVYVYFSIKLADGVQRSPRVKSRRVGFKGDETQYTDLRIGLDKKHFILNRMFLEVEPRPYKQRIKIGISSSARYAADVVIEPNETNIVVNLPERNLYEYRLENPSRYRTNIRPFVFSIDLPKELKSYRAPLIIDTNFTNPEINGIQVFQKEKNIIVEVNEDDSLYIQGTVHRIKWFVDPAKSKLELVTTSGDLVQVPFKNEVRNTHWKRRFIYDFSSVPDGVYTHLKATAIDAQNNKTVKEVAEIFVIDNTAPTVHFNLDEGSDVVSLDDIFIAVSDNSDRNPQITSVKLTGGPASDEIHLPVRKVDGGQYQLEYPILFPSFVPNSGYTALVTVEDAHGNTAEAALSFKYKPHKIVLEGGLDSTFYIPAVSQEVIHKDGSKLIETEPLKLADGSYVNGTYDVLATLRADAPTAFVVNGMRIEPGQTLAILSDHDFSTSTGKLSIGAYPAEAGVEGTSNLLVMTTAPNSPILSAELTTWLGRANLSANSWRVKQVLDPISIQASPAPGNPCRLTTAMVTAAQSDPIHDPICEFVWTQIPDESERVISEHGEFQMTQLEGTTFTLGEQKVAYELAIYSGDGTRIVVGSGERNLEVVSAQGSVEFTPTQNFTAVNRVIEQIDLQMKQITGANCPVTLDGDQAKRQNTCLFEWTEVPTGLQQRLHAQPQLTGAITEAGTHAVQWRVSKFAPSGKRVTLNEQSYEIKAIDPQLPTISMTQASENMDKFYTSIDGGDSKDILIEAPQSDLLVQISRDGQTVLQERYNLLKKDGNTIFQSLETLPKGLWGKQFFEISAGYSQLPDVTATKTIQAIGVPSDSIVPVITVEQREAVDTELLPVTITMRDTRKPHSEYDPQTMGNWEVRVAYDTRDDAVPLSDFLPLQGTSVTTAIDISDVNMSSVRLYAEARLISEVEGYERLEKSPSPAFIAVLNGEKITGDLTSRAFSGPAPLSTYFKLNVSSYLERRAVGKVTWQVSTDNGVSWTEYVPEEERRKFQFYRTFELGTYLVRARIENKYSKAVSHTEQISVTAYEKIAVALMGPNTVISGSSGMIKAEITKNDMEAEEGDFVLEWSEDAGKTFKTGSGTVLEIKGIEDGLLRIVARVRAVEAPEDDQYAYSTARHNVTVRGPRQARAMLIGQNKLEVGKSYDFTARLMEPYSNMNIAMTGEFLFPDGTRVSGDEATYTVRKEDQEAQLIEINYTAWLEGYKETTSNSTLLRAFVWAYKWPDFKLSVSSDVKNVPATIKASVRAPGQSSNLDTPVYEWVLPSGAKDVRKRQVEYRSFTVDEAGDHEIKVTISDARGNETVLSQTLKIEPTPEYSVNLSYTPSNRYNRSPLQVYLRPKIKGGHPRDRVVSYQYRLNGENIEARGAYARAELDAGENEVELEIESRMGVSTVGRIVIDVNENQPPMCEATVQEYSSAWVAIAKCKDLDGRVVKYNWTLEGEPVSVSGTRLTVSKRGHDTLPHIQAGALDDAGALSVPVIAELASQ